MIEDEDRCQVPCWFLEFSINAPKCTPCSCPSTGCIFRAAKETFTQLNIEYGLLENSIFDFQCTNGIMTSFDDGGAFANQINALHNDKRRPMSYLKYIDR